MKRGDLLLATEAGVHVPADGAEHHYSEEAGVPEEAEKPADGMRDVKTLVLRALPRIGHVRHCVSWRHTYACRFYVCAGAGSVASLSTHTHIRAITSSKRSSRSPLTRFQINMCALTCIHTHPMHAHARAQNFFRNSHRWWQRDWGLTRRGQSRRAAGGTSGAARPWSRRRQR